MSDFKMYERREWYLVIQCRIIPEDKHALFYKTHDVAIIDCNVKKEREGKQW